MVLRESKLVGIDLSIANFTLKDTKGNDVERDMHFGENGLLLTFTCNHCPYAIALWDRLIMLSKEISMKGVNTLAINPNINPNYPEDSPEASAAFVRAHQISFPYLIDETQSVAAQYEALCTPEYYLFNSNKDCVYHGRFDDNWKDDTAVSSHDLKNAVSNMLEGKETLSQIPSMGCSIKWNG